MQMNKLMAAVFVGLLLLDCGTSKDERLPPGGSNMLEPWNDGSSVTRATTESRTTLQRPVSERENAVAEDPGELLPDTGI